MDLRISRSGSNFSAVTHQADTVATDVVAVWNAALNEQRRHHPVPQHSAIHEIAPPEYRDEITGLRAGIFGIAKVFAQAVLLFVGALLVLAVGYCFLFVMNPITALFFVACGWLACTWALRLLD
ncbi:MAG TPA: hypothetical protein VMU69_22770 [Bradyrhizobium sp.]|nr:hypothetical protein [Bradyrhizobium sp.]